MNSGGPSFCYCILTVDIIANQAMSRSNRCPMTSSKAILGARNPHFTAAILLKELHHP